MHKLPFFLLFFISIHCFSQDYIYQHFGVDQGLPSSEVYDMYQDKKGYLWFATDKGLSRYNGYEFENFDVNDGLTGNVILKFYPQSNGQIWCYSLHDQSLFYFDEVFDSFQPYEFNHLLQKEIEKTSIVKSVCLSQQGNLHIGGFKINGELIISKEGKVQRKHPSKEVNPQTVRTILKKDIKPHEESFLFMTNEKGFPFSSEYKGAHMMGCWLSNGQKAVLYDTGSIRIKELNKEDIVVTTEYQTIRLKRIDDTHFFVGYKFGGGSIVNDRGEVITQFLMNESVSDFLIDHHQGYWLSTLHSGVYYVKSPQIQQWTGSNEFQNEDVSSLASNQEDLYVGFEDGTIGIISKEQHFKLLETSEKKSPAFVEYDADYQKLLYYSNNALYDATAKEVILDNYIVGISEPQAGKVFISMRNGVRLTDYEGVIKELIASYRVLDACLWKDRIYAATPKGVLKEEKGRLVALGHESKLLTYRAEDIDIASNGNRLYIASQGTGVIVFDEKIRAITTEDGLNSNQINEIYVENDSVVWASTNKGLNKITFSGDSFQVTGIDKQGGLLSNEVKDIEIKNDTVWVGTNEGICFFPKSLLIHQKNQQSFLEIKQMDSNGEGLTRESMLELTYDQNTIDFTLQEISYIDQENIQYQYRLLGLHDEWKTTQNRNIRFSPLSPGNYVFEAKSSLGQGNSSAVVKQAFVIHPPFWNTWWFYTICAFVFGGIIYLFFKIRVLTYNKDLTREFIRLLVKRLKRKENVLSLRELGNDVKIRSNDILYVKSANNYVNIVTELKTYTIRLGIGKFLDRIPDKLEYVRIHRSYIVRLDKITAKSKSEIFIHETRIPVGQRYLQNLKKIHF